MSTDPHPEGHSTALHMPHLHVGDYIDKYHAKPRYRNDAQYRSNMISKLQNNASETADIGTQTCNDTYVSDAMPLATLYLNTETKHVSTSAKKENDDAESRLNNESKAPLINAHEW